MEPFDDGENSVRLLGIDTPETNYYGRSQGEHAGNATDFLKELVSAGDIVRIESDQEERDKYGRILGYVFMDDENIIEQRVFFFREQNAIDAGYTLRSKPVSLSNFFLKNRSLSREKEKGENNTL